MMAGSSPFKAQLQTAGAVFTERWGVELAEHFGDPRGEYAAVRHAVGLVDFSFRGLLEVTGGDRVRWLNGQITNDAKQLGPGGGMLAAVLTAKGHLLSDLAVYGLPDAFWVDLNRDRLAPVATSFDRYIIADDVAVSNRSDRIAHLMLAGPAARDLVAGVAGAELAGLSPWQHREARIGGVPVRLMATRWLALPGYDVFVPAAQAGDVWAMLGQSGDRLGLRPVGLAALERLRVEAGWPWYGRDFDDSTLLMEALTQEHVSFTKGCYIGQEVVIRIQHQGHINKRLCGLFVEGGSVPPAGSTLHLGERKVGTLTSAAVSPALQRVIALGYVRHEGWEPGTKLRLVSGDTSAEAEVAQLPFIGQRP
jgi:folate-binding protein YgfZ